jgi:hypothetical protein
MSTPFAPDHLPLIGSRLGRGRCHRSPVPSPTGQRSRRPNRRSGSVTGSGPRDNAQVPIRLSVPSRTTSAFPGAPSRPPPTDDGGAHSRRGRPADLSAPATTTASRWSSDRAGAPAERRRERFQRRPPSGLHSWGAVDRSTRRRLWPVPQRMGVIGAASRDAVCLGLACGRALCRHRWATSRCRGHRRRQKPCSLGVTEGTRTPDLQGHNLGPVTEAAPASQVRDAGDLRADPGGTDARRRSAGTPGGGVVVP